jgi:hypothetical protein
MPPQLTYGQKNQISFTNYGEFYEALGYFSNTNHPVKIVWEHNDNQGAWGKEGRIEFYCSAPSLSGFFKHTAGRGNSLKSRVNCNTYVQTLVHQFGFTLNTPPNSTAIRLKVPPQYLSDFDRGFGM